MRPSRPDASMWRSSPSRPGGTTLEKLNSLGGVLKTQDITAGNSSGINDGACALMIASDEKVAELGVEPLALLVDHAVAGVDHEQMGIGPVEAINKLLAANNLTIADIDLIEINEAFAAQYLACEKLLGLDRNKVNVNGGAIAARSRAEASGQEARHRCALHRRRYGHRDPYREPVGLIQTRSQLPSSKTKTRNL
jgi:acetyl-CoA acetyltransferase